MVINDDRRLMPVRVLVTMHSNEKVQRSDGMVNDVLSHITQIRHITSSYH